MTFSTRASCVSLLAACCSLAAHGATLFKDPQFKVEVVHNVVYAHAAVRQPAPSQRALLLDIYQPVAPNLNRRPAMIAIHGGGFLFGNKAEMNDLCRELAARGYVCFSINYRMVPDDPPGTAKDAYERAVMAAVEDAHHAAEWIESHDAKYRVDRARMFIGGSSAGAVTSMLLAYDPEIKTPRFRAVADLWGTMGPRVNWIRKGDPPLLIIHGKDDQTITVSAAEQLNARATAVGLKHETFLIDGMGHGVPLNLEVEGKTLLEDLTDFFYAEMGRK